MLFCNRNKTNEHSCLKKTLKWHLPRVDDLVRVIIENDTDFDAHILQNKILQTLNQMSQWTFEVVKLGGNVMEFDHLSAKNSNLEGNVPVKYALIFTSTSTAFEEKLRTLLQGQRVYSTLQLVVCLLNIRDNYEETAKELLMTAWNLKFFDVAVMTPTHSPKEWQTYAIGYYGKAKKCLDNAVPKLSSHCENATFHLHFSGAWNNKLGCTVDAISLKYPPYVIDETNGFEVHLMKNLGERLNIKFNLLIEEDGADNWGIRNETDGSWSGRLGYVDREMAVGVGNLQDTPEYQKYFDFSHGYYYDSMVWVVPIAELAPQWMCIFMPYSFQIWLVCIVTFVTGGLFLYLSYIKREKPNYRSLNSTLFISLELILGVSSKALPLTRLTRSFFLSIATFNIFLSSFYQSNLINVLTHPVYQHQIDTLEGILQSNLRIGGLKSYRQFFNVSEDKNAIRIFNMYQSRHRTNDTAYNWLKTVANERNIATIASSFYVKYIMASGDQAVVENGFPKVYILKEIIMFYQTKIVMPKGYPLMRRIDQVIDRMTDGGLIGRWANNATIKLAKYESRKNTIFFEGNGKVLTMDDLQGVFVLLLLGHCCGVVVFVIELMFHRFDGRRKLQRLWRKLRGESVKCLLGKRH